MNILQASLCIIAEFTKETFHQNHMWSHSILANSWWAFFGSFAVSFAWWLKCRTQGTLEISAYSVQTHFDHYWMVCSNLVYGASECTFMPQSIWLRCLKTNILYLAHLILRIILVFGDWEKRSIPLFKHKQGSTSFPCDCDSGGKADRLLIRSLVVRSTAC